MGARVKLGATTCLTDQSIGPCELARALEERGFSSLYLPEHTHVPTSRKTPPPLGGSAEMPAYYQRCLDPFVALTAAAAVTSRLTLGTGVCLVAQRDPIVTAKAAATLDLLSHGRLVFGIGFGWNREEIEDHGVAFRRRRARGREHVLAMQQLWANERASFAGEFVHFEESWSWPKPVQQPHLPVLIGGFGGPKVFAHIAEYADGWYAMGLTNLRTMLPDLHRAVEATGRDPAGLRIVAPCDPSSLPGGLDDDALAGVSEVLVGLPTAPADIVLRLLDRHAKWLL